MKIKKEWKTLILMMFVFLAFTDINGRIIHINSDRISAVERCGKNHTKIWTGKSYLGSHIVEGNKLNTLSRITNEIATEKTLDMIKNAKIIKGVK